MSRFGSGVRTSAGSVTLPLCSLYSVAANGCILRELGIFNTTSTALAISLRRLTTAGTKPANETRFEMDTDGPTGACLFHGTHTVGPTIPAAEIRHATLGAAVGAGVIWTFGDRGLVIPSGSANGVGIIIPNGSGQICDVYVEWEE